MMKQWTLFPTVLQRKFLLTLLAGIASAGISAIICVATKDHILLALGIPARSFVTLRTDAGGQNR